ncbi:hypothetical protein DFA_06053 [Cavenderia fasciculata]|uniref:Large ribosomal subunit protein mL43 n=1 Tax=Cavenderia fasciculata TaxID=261658 RepID=F4PJZ1_CACFS|nr:uncharacterized protein DFA_06053 [Cavenderia fasciculata]EGG23915.1 hypothetical protein DFA_06053 [Cavenderia fasciculata]|eukprot:XP_004361766.1 hypothetical protein DFA_06053 [Cavenderia fasciculata]
MSKNGVWQLKKVVLQYCDHSGSSKFIRNILPTLIQEYKQNNPQIEFVEEVNRGRHPQATATYVSGKKKIVPLRGEEEEKVVKHLDNLRNTAGFKPMKFGNRYIRQTQSIQGLWHPFLNFNNQSSSAPSEQKQ